MEFTVFQSQSLIDEKNPPVKFMEGMYLTSMAFGV
jgi:hypothetical protein